MGTIDASWHLLSFAAPAIVVALVVALGARLLLPGGVAGRGWLAHAGVNAVAGVGVLALGLWWFGVDGKMASYAALAGVVATSQWICSRAWRH
jgi:hypothetical protein